MPNPANLKAQMERVALELLEGRGAHADSLGCVEDISAELASRKPTGFEHSIFEIVLHLNYWMEADLKRMRGTPDPYPARASEGWPESSATNEESWRACIRKFRELLDEFKSSCRADAASWAMTAAVTHPSHERNASSMGALIFQAIAHNSYHLGQIVDLRRAHGAWPPAKGGDTW